MGAAVSDHPQMAELTEYLVEHKIPFSVASMRADMLTEQIAHALAQSGQRTMTVAPEAASVCALRLTRALRRSTFIILSSWLLLPECATSSCII